MSDAPEGLFDPQTRDKYLDRLADLPNEHVPTHMRTQELPRYENLSFGTSLGTQESDQQVFQLNDDRYRHTAIIGRTGSGKSNLVHQMEREDIRNGAGVFILAAHEEDALYPLACVPDERMDDVVLLDFSNEVLLPCMNPLDADGGDRRTRDKAIENVIELICDENRYEWTGPRFERMARDGLALLLGSPIDEDRAVANLARVYAEPEYVKGLLRYCTDRHVYDQWTKVVPQEMKSNDSGELVHWFSSKVSRYAHDRTLRHVFGPGCSTVDVGEVVDKGKVLIVYVPEERIGKSAAHSICKWLTMQLRDAIMSRTARSDSWPGLDLGRYEGKARERTTSEPFFVYVDELAKFATSDFEALLAESRKQSVGFVLSFQTLSQTRTLDKRTGQVGQLEQAVLGNVGSIVCYPMGEPDVQLLAVQIGVSHNDLRWIRRYRPLARLMQSNQPANAKPLEVRLKPEPDNPKAPRRVARNMALSGVWAEVDGSTNLAPYLRALDAV
jgi:hypothetical protein